MDCLEDGWLAGDLEDFEIEYALDEWVQNADAQQDALSDRSGALAGSLRRLLKSERDLTDARAALDQLAHRLRDGGPETSREEIRKRVQYAAEKINSIVPRSPLR